MMLYKYESLCAVLVLLNFCFIKAFLIGDSCKYDDDCYVENSYCELQQICECKQNFIVNEDGENCIALIGAHCHSKYDCATLPNSICKDDRCVCDQGYVPDSQQTKCVQIAQQIKDTCENDIQCRARLGQESHCYNRQCQCYPGHHFDIQCIASKGLHEECRNNSQCYIGEEYQHTIVCSSGRCACATGYHENFKLCIENGSSSQSRGLFAILLMTLLILSFHKLTHYT